MRAFPCSSLCVPVSLDVNAGLLAVERASGVGNSHGSPTKGNHLPGQVEMSPFVFSDNFNTLIIAIMTTRAINIHPDDTYMLTMRAQACQCNDFWCNITALVHYRHAPPPLRRTHRTIYIPDLGLGLR